MAKPKKSVDGSVEIGSAERRIEFKPRKFKFSEKQKKLLEICLNPETKIVFVTGPAGSSKAQPLSEPILTPNGWVNMGDIKKGDLVMTPHGTPTEVEGVFPQGSKEVFKIEFNDGSFTHCCDDHLWLTQTNAERYNRKKVKGGRIKNEKIGQVRSLKEIRESLYVSGTTRLNHYIPITQPVQFEPKHHLIHPYLLGALIGDGGLTIGTRFTTADKEIVESFEKLLPSNHSIRTYKDQYAFSIVGENQKNLCWDEIREMGLNTKSHLKFIPENYLIDSIENRISLLQGLMDTDGHTDSERGRATYTTSSQRLAFDVKALIESLGGVARITSFSPKFTYLGKKKIGKIAYRVNVSLPSHIIPFSLKRKVEKYKPLTKYFPARAIRSIELIGEEECQCIMIKDDSHLYLTRDYIVTHNTYMAIYSALNLLASNKEWDMTYIRSLAESADRGIGSLPGTVDEKFMPFMIPLEDKMDEIITTPTMINLKKDAVINAMPVNFIRGSSWTNKIVVADECFEDSVYIETDRGRVVLKKILQNPSKYKALSFNENSQSFEFKKILNTFSKGEKYISEIILDGRSKIRATKNHRFLTNLGWKRLDELTIGDSILSSSCNKHSKQALNNDQLSIIYGSILGDGHLQEVNNYSYRLKCLHSIKQEEYLTFKADCFQSKTQEIKKNGYAQKPAVRFVSKCFYLPVEKELLKKLAIDNLSDQSLAIAWQDDGYFNAKVGHGVLWSCATSEYHNGLFAQKLNSMGYSCSPEKRKKGDKIYFTIRFKKEGFDKMSAAIAPYIHESMSYKIPEKYRDSVGTYKWDSDFKNFSLRVVSKINLDICTNSTFDIEVEDNHNFVVSSVRTGDGTKVVAHNCQNFSKKELVTIITRIGENAKVFLCGDLMQSDIRSSGFNQFIELFDDPESEANGIHVFKFDKDDIYRSEILKFIVGKLEQLDKKV